MTSSISSFEIINAVIPDPKAFFWIDTPVADTSVVDPNGIKVLLVSGLSEFFLKGKPVYSNGSKSLSKNPPDCPILYNRVLDNFVLADELFIKALRSLETCIMVNKFYEEK